LRPGRFFTCRALTSIKLDAGEVLEQVIEGLPVVAGRPHEVVGVRLRVILQAAT
jgi:hypothetical protein